jgi:hypothetical protein
VPTIKDDGIIHKVLCVRSELDPSVVCLLRRVVLVMAVNPNGTRVAAMRGADGEKDVSYD